MLKNFLRDLSKLTTCERMFCKEGSDPEMLIFLSSYTDGSDGRWTKDSVRFLMHEQYFIRLLGTYIRFKFLLSRNA